MNYRLGREDTPEGPTALDAARAAHQRNLAIVREILNRTAADPEALAQAAATLNQSYNVVCENDPVYRADQNMTGESEMEELLNAVSKKMTEICAANRREYLEKRGSSQHRHLYPLPSDTPVAGDDEEEERPGPGEGWLQWLRKWQPFADRPGASRPAGLSARRRSRRFSSFPVSRSPARVHVYRPPGANLHRAFVRPSRFRRPLDQRVQPEVHIGSPMDIDLNRTRHEQAEAIQRTGSYIPKTVERAADITMASVADRDDDPPHGSSGRDGRGPPPVSLDPSLRRRQRVMEIGRALKRRLTPQLKRKYLKETSAAAVENESSSPSGESHESWAPTENGAAARHTAAADVHESTPRILAARQQAHERNNGSSSPPTSPAESCALGRRADRSRAEKGGAADAWRPPSASVSVVKLNSKQTQTELKSQANQTSSQVQPYWKIDIEQRDGVTLTSLREGLGRALYEASKRLDLAVLVKKLTLDLYVCEPQRPPQPSGTTDYDPELMEAVQEQLAQLQARLTAQEAELARHRDEAETHRRTIEDCRTREREQDAAIADHQRRAEEQAADRAALLEQIRRGEATAPSSNPIGGPAGNSGPQPSGQGPPSSDAERTDSVASDQAHNAASDSRGNVEARIQQMEAQFREQNRVLRAEIERMRMTKQQDDAHRDLQRRAEDAVATSQRHRELIAGRNKAAVAARYKTESSRPMTGAEEAEKDMLSCLTREDEHRAGLPRTGEGFHYLLGETPFWRQPWPRNWKVVKPWEFSAHYDHKDMLQLLKNLQLAMFDGEPEGYPQWQCMFYKTVHVQDMDVDVKYNYLIRHLSPKVKAFAIRGVSLSKSNYCHAITRLEKKYGAGERQIEMSMARLTSIKPFQPQETAKAEEFLQRLQGYLDESGGTLSRETAQTLMPTLRQIIPQTWLREYLKWAEMEKTQTNPATLLAFLTDLVDLEEELKECRGVARAPAPVPTRRRAAPLAPNAVRPPIREAARPPPTMALVAGEGPDCPCCTGAHRLKQCPRFLQEYDNVERRELLEQLDYCLVCFTGTHRGRGCLNRRLCELCRKEHSTWAHVADDDEPDGVGYLAEEDDREAAFAAEDLDDELTGACLGEGFMEEDEQERVAEDDLRYGFMAFEPQPFETTGGPRRSVRLGAKQRSRSAGPPAGWASPGGETATHAAVSPRAVARPRARTPRSPSPSPRSGRPPALRPAVPATPVPATRRLTTAPPPGRWPPSSQPKAVTFQEPTPTPPRAAPVDPVRAWPSRPTTPSGALELARQNGTYRDEVQRPPGQRVGVGLQQVLANVQNPRSKEHMTINALVDTGSNHTAISKRLADTLGVDGVSAPYRVITFGGEVFQQPSRLVRVTIRNTSGQIERTVMVRSVANLCGDLRVWAWNDLKRSWPHLREITFPDPVGDLRVDLLIGTDNADLVRVTAPDRLGPGPQDPVVRTTTFGLVALGLVRPWNDSLSDRVNLVQAFACPHYVPPDRQRTLEMESALYWDLRRLFSVEHQIEEDFLRHVKDSKTLGREQAEAAAQVHASRRYDQTRRQYQAGIPWRDHQRPANNLWDAVKLFKNYVRRAGPASEQIEQMTSTIDGWIKAGYAQIVSPAEARRADSFIIPSFVVTRVDKTTTQHRLVINAAKEFNGRCLNDYIARTPDVMNNLYEVLLRFRQGRHAYTADIQHMFLQVLTEPEDRRYIRVLYQPVREGGVFVVECSRHMFGLRSSPYVAMEVIKMHADARRSRYPLAAAAVARASIVDDVLVAVDEEEELYGTHQELEDMFREMSMTVHKCASSNEAFMESLPPAQRAKQVRLEDIEASNPELMPVIKALGMVYRPEDDCFRFEYSHEPPKKWTLRGMVAAVARLYDPLGLVAPFLMAGRAIVQIIWLNGTSWDETVDPATAQKCDLWVARAAELTEIQIPRRVQGGDWGVPEESRLVVFSDACRIGYAAAAYYVAQGGSRLIAARTRVAPTKKDESVQRLELAGCQLATDVAVEVCQALGLSLQDASFYTDSMTSLAWLRTTSRMSVYVSNRVCKVRDRTEVQQWKYVPGTLNPADIASRGARPRALVKNRMWFEGPEFLRTGREPDQPELIEDQAVKEELISYENQLRKVTLFCSLVPPQPITEFILQYVQSRSLLQRSVRVICLVLRAVSILRRSPLELGQIFQEVWSGVLDALTLDHQSRHWGDEVARLRRGEEPRALRSLRPYLDAKGVMRMRSRLNGCWWLDYEAKNPVIVHGDGGFALLLLTHFHAESLMHAGGPTQLLSRARTHYWVTSARRISRKAIALCAKCRKDDRQVTRPVMADLHPTRLGSGRDLRAFKEVGIDMAGPFITKTPVGTRRRVSDQKRYLLIVSCCATRAVCLELMMSAEAESCVMALERFVAVYGCPERINSDAGSNLLATREEIRRRWRWWEQVRTKEFAQHPEIRWENNPPYSPNWGGHYERLIGVAKKALGKVMHNRAGALHDEELGTLFKRVQGLLNDRPITAVVQDDDSLLGLTPNCFLKTGGRRPLAAPGSEEVGLLRRYRMLDNVIQQYWKQFISDYASSLHKTEKWTRGATPLGPGDIVTITHQGLPYGRWPLGRIIEAYPGRDGVVRSVLVETWVGGRKTELKRSVSGMMPVLKAEPQTQ